MTTTTAPDIIRVGTSGIRMARLVIEGHTVVTANPLNPSKVYELCDYCDGTGYRPGYDHVDNGRCHPCYYSGTRRSFESVAEAVKVFARRDREHARRTAKAAEAAEKAQARHEAQIEASDALVAARPLLAAALDIDINAERVPFAFRRLIHEIDMIQQHRASTLDEEVLAKVEAAVQAVADEAAAATPVPAGRQVVSGQVLAVKVVEGYYGTTTKMLVSDYRGFRVWGSVPSAIWDVEKGQAVSFTATLEAGNEVGFGFFARPTKAAVTA